MSQKNHCKCSSLQPYSRERFPRCDKVSPVVIVLLGFPRVQQLYSARERFPQQKCYSSACSAPQQKVVISLLCSNLVKKGYHPNLLQEIYLEGIIQEGDCLCQGGKGHQKTEQAQGLYMTSWDEVFLG